MNASKAELYFWPALLGGFISTIVVTAFCCVYIFSRADLHAIYVDGFAIIYVPMALFVFGIPGAIIGVVARFIRERKS